MVSITHFSKLLNSCMYTSGTHPESWFIHIIKEKKYSLLLIILFNTALPRKIQSFWQPGCNPIFFPFAMSKFNSPHLCFKGNLIVDGADKLLVWHLDVKSSGLKMMNQCWFPLNWTKCDLFHQDQTSSLYSIITWRYISNFRHLIFSKINKTHTII